jgi:hypothetical protein
MLLLFGIYSIWMRTIILLARISYLNEIVAQAWQTKQTEGGREWARLRRKQKMHKQVQHVWQARSAGIERAIRCMSVLVFALLVWAICSGGEERGDGWASADRVGAARILAGGAGMASVGV